MGKQPQTAATLPLIPLPRGSVLLPGLVHRVDVTSGRPDIPALLAHVYERAAAQGSAVAIDSIPIACVPLSSKPIVGPDGQPLIESADKTDDTSSFSRHELDPPPLFGFGVAAKIVGIDGRGAGEFSLRVEGTARLRFDALSSRRPFLQGKVTHLRESVDLNDPELQPLFSLLRSRSRELVTILRISSLLPRAKGTGRPPALPPLLTKRLELFIMARQVEDAGLLADFMTNLVEASHDEKLTVLAALDLKIRLATVIQLLERQVAGIKNNFKIASLPLHIIHPSPDHVAGKGLSSLPLTAIRLGPHSTPRPFPPPEQAPDEDDEANELDQLRQKLEAAKLPPDAARAAHRELRRLQNMMPMNQEYHVTRNWLETMSDLPWASYTDDRLGPETLARARKQLDDDHYGLDKVKRRLIQYLAVLRLKKSLQAKDQPSKAEAEDASNELDPATDAVAHFDAGHGAHNTNSSSSSDDPCSSDVPDGQQSDPLPDDGRLKKEDGSSQPPRRQPLMSPSQPFVDRPPIMLLVGPPGVGKTSLAKSVALALGRKFHRISLGGIRDEAEIRGHRRTYVAAMPGLIVQGLRKVAVANPVFLLDEIDKIGMASLHGDPSAAMLEVLDPEQNFCFQDHYLGVPIDLSHVLFIATANSLDPIPAPLLDRMETIQLTGYTPLEKSQIAIRHLVPKQMRANGLAEGQVILGQDVISKMIQSYTREAGVRNLEREIGSVFRAKAVEFSEARDGHRLDEYRRQVRVADLEAILGTETFEDEMAEKESRPGVVTGLVAYSTGGDGSILFIEMADMPGKGGRLQLTGKLGDVLKESVEVALSWVKAHAFELGLTEEPRGDLMKDRSIHVHCPSGAVPKDGPSSGIGQAIALISLFSGRPVPPTMAMTGEISLRGRVTAVGGIKEKLIGALRAGVKSVLLPAQNRKETKDLPQEVKDGLRIEYISHIWEAIRLVWPDSHWAADGPCSGIESRL